MAVARALRKPPPGAWTRRAVWREILLIHFPVPPAALAQYVPLPLDTHSGQAWITILPFDVSDARVRPLPRLPGLDTYAELQIRTYVRFNGKPGLFLLSADSTQPLEVVTARWRHLPYFHARTTLGRRGDTYFFHCARLHPAKQQAQFAAHFTPSGHIFSAESGSLLEFLLERYCLFAVNGKDEVFASELHHRPWPVRMASARIAMSNLLPQGLGLPPAPPVLHFCDMLDVRTWPMRPAPKAPAPAHPQLRSQINESEHPRP